MIDPALLRPGRIDRLLYVPSPDQNEREEIFKVHLKDKPIAKDVSLSALAEQTVGYVGADIAAICREVVMLSLREVIKPGMAKEAMRRALKDGWAGSKHFDVAMKKVRKTMTPETMMQYEETMLEFMQYVETRKEREKPYG
jgi:transitional endoplasmic reticulum ATPase